ncbi:MAG: PD-(D/E)XK nuclease family protein, partial [Candidatus Dormibacteria bacterium]
MLGPPGSGKTQLLAELAAEHLRRGGEPDRLFLVARSWAGRRDLVRRISALAGGGALRLPELHTHESLAGWVRHHLGRGGDERPVLTRAQQRLAMRAALRQVRGSLPRLHALTDDLSCAEDALEAVVACKRALVEPGLLAGRLSGAPPSLAELVVIAAAYDEALARMGAADPQDGPGRALEVLQDHPAQGWADLLLVDEAEDLSPGEWVLLRELQARLAGSGRLLLAGTPEVAVPGFAGATGESSARPLAEYFPQELHPREWVLPSASAGVIEGVRARLFPGPEVLAQPLPEAAFRLQPEVQAWLAEDGTAEGLAVGREILRGRLAGELAFPEVGVIVPGPGEVRSGLLAGLAALGIPVRQQLLPWARQPAVLAVMAWLGWLEDASDSRRLLSALGQGPRKLRAQDLRWLRRRAGRRNQTPAQEFAALGASAPPAGEQSEGERHGTEARLTAAARRWGQLARRRGGSRRLGLEEVSETLGELARGCGYAEAMLGQDGAALALRQLTALALELAAASTLLTGHPPDLGQLLALLEEGLVAPGTGSEDVHPGQVDAVEVLTPRQAKGRHWRWVFVCGCAAGRMAHGPDSAGLLEGTEAAELVQRVPELEDVFARPEQGGEAGVAQFLVAISRGRERVVLTRARRYERGPEDPSPFLQLLRSEGVREIPAPRAWLVSRDDLVVQRALEEGTGEPAAGLPLAAALRSQAAAWDPVTDGPASAAEPLRLSASKLREWLACPRKLLAANLVSETEESVTLALGKAAHRLLEELYRDPGWQEEPAQFSARARVLIRDRLLPDLRESLEDALQVQFCRVWLEGLAQRWQQQVLVPGPQQVGQPLVQEEAFDLDMGGWRLRGKVDALWQHPRGEIEIVDFKSGRHAAETALRREVMGSDEEGPSNWQLPLYRLASERGAFSDQLQGRQPVLFRNWYLAEQPGKGGPFDPRGFSATEAADRKGTVVVPAEEQ